MGERGGRGGRGEGKSKKVKGKSEEEESRTSNIELPTSNVEGGEEVGALVAMTPVECEGWVGEVVGELEGKSRKAKGKSEEEGTSNIELPTSNVEGRNGGNVDGTNGERRRSRVMTRDVRWQICCYLQAGMSRRQAAAFVGCHHTAITRAAQRDAQFAAELEQSERISEALPMLRIVKASRKSWRAAAWLVKNNKPHGWLRREHQEERDREDAESVVRTERLMREADAPPQEEDGEDEAIKWYNQQMQPLQKIKEDGTAQDCRQVRHEHGAEYG